MGGTDQLASPVAVMLAAAFGAMWGSFFNVCIARIPLHQSVVRPGSHCFSCGRPVRAFDNIPIVSYLLLRGRCRLCGVSFSPRYLLVVLLSAALSAFVYFRFVVAAPELEAAVRLARYALYFAFTGVLIVLSFIDLDTKRLPDAITLPAIPILFAAGFGAHDVRWIERLIGLAVGYLAVRIIADGYYYLTGREGLGLGDGKLLSVIGAVLGWKAIPVVIFMGSFIGIVVSVPLLLARRRKVPVAAIGGEPKGAEIQEGEVAGAAMSPPDVVLGVSGEAPVRPVRHAEVPFGPFLSLSALVYLLMAEQLWGWVSGFIWGV